MNHLPLTLYWMLLLNTVVTSLPAPVNVHVSSLNFYHVLHWEPGPGTPAGTVYQVNTSTHMKKNLKTTSVKLRLKQYFMRYDLTVWAFYNGTLSPPGSVSFIPFLQTTIGPPRFTLTECGNCIKINISLPEAREDIEKIYSPEFKIARKIRGGNTLKPIITPNKTHTLDNLTPGTEYCVQVTMETLQNRHIKPSNWSCINLGTLKSRAGSVIAGAVSALLIITVSVVIISVFLLYYTGFICKLKADLPRFMTMTLIQDPVLTPERTIPDQLFIKETCRQKNWSAIPHPSTGGAHSDNEDEEQEEDEFHLYVNRNVALSSGISSCQESCDTSASGKPVASVDSGNMSDRMSADVEVEEEFGAQVEGAEDSFISGSRQTADTNEPEEVETEEVCENSGSVNLFSVTLAALDARHKEEEEEEEDTRDFLKSDLESLLPRDSKLAQGHTDSQTETQSDDLELEDFNETGFKGNWTDARMYGLQNYQTQREEDEEEEDEEFSEYLSHR